MVLFKGEKYGVPINMGEEDFLTQIQFVDRLLTRCSILREDTLLFKMTCCMLLFIGEHPVKQGVDESNVYAKGQPVTSCIFLVEPKLACCVKGEEVICQRACKG